MRVCDCDRQRYETCDCPEQPEPEQRSALMCEKHNYVYQVGEECRDCVALAEQHEPQEAAEQEPRFSWGVNKTLVSYIKDSSINQHYMVLGDEIHMESLVDLLNDLANTKGVNISRDDMEWALSQAVKLEKTTGHRAWLAKTKATGGLGKLNERHSEATGRVSRIKAALGEKT